MGTGVRGTNVLTNGDGHDTIGRNSTGANPLSSGSTVSGSRKTHKCKTHVLPVVTVDLEHRTLTVTVRHRGDYCENVIPLVELGLQPLGNKTEKKKEPPSKPSVPKVDSLAEDGASELRPEGVGEGLTDAVKGEGSTE